MTANGRPMSFGESIRSGFQNYVSWEGRASRSEYWYWVLFGTILLISTAIFDSLIEARTAIFSGLAGIVIFLPTLAVSGRRLRDAGLSPVLILLYFILSGLWGLIIGLLPSKQPFETAAGSYDNQKRVASRMKPKSPAILSWPESAELDPLQESPDTQLKDYSFDAMIEEAFLDRGDSEVGRALRVAQTAVSLVQGLYFGEYFPKDKKSLAEEASNIYRGETIDEPTKEAPVSVRVGVGGYTEPMNAEAILDYLQESLRPARFYSRSEDRVVFRYHALEGKKGFLVVLYSKSNPQMEGRPSVTAWAGLTKD